jgi:hypothetical protein
VKQFNDILQKGIPADFRKDFKYGLPRVAISLAEEQDKCQALDPQDPKLQRLNQEITDIINEESRKTWQASCSAVSCFSELFSIR